MARKPRFDAHWQRRRRWASFWRVLRMWLVLALILGASWWLLQEPQQQGEWQSVNGNFPICGQVPAKTPKTGCVIDGDTIAIGRRKIRITGYDAPELNGECEAEKQLALRARIALRDWLNQAPFQMDGGAQPPRDKYGRELRQLKRLDAKGQTNWLHETMIEDKLGRANGWGGYGREWCEE